MKVHVPVTSVCTSGGIDNPLGVSCPIQDTIWILTPSLTMLGLFLNSFAFHVLRSKFMTNFPSQPILQWILVLNSCLLVLGPLYVWFSQALGIFIREDNPSLCLPLHWLHDAFSLASSWFVVLWMVERFVTFRRPKHAWPVWHRMCSHVAILVIQLALVVTLVGVITTKLIPMASSEKADSSMCLPWLHHDRAPEGLLSSLAWTQAMALMFSLVPCLALAIILIWLMALLTRINHRVQQRSLELGHYKVMAEEVKTAMQLKFVSSVVLIGSLFIMACAPVGLFAFFGPGQDFPREVSSGMRIDWGGVEAPDIALPTNANQSWDAWWGLEPQEGDETYPNDTEETNAAEDTDKHSFMDSLKVNDAKMKNNSQWKNHNDSFPRGNDGSIRRDFLSVIISSIVNMLRQEGKQLVGDQITVDDHGGLLIIGTNISHAPSREAGVRDAAGGGAGGADGDGGSIHDSNVPSNRSLAQLNESNFFPESESSDNVRGSNNFWRNIEACVWFVYYTYTCVLLVPVLLISEPLFRHEWRAKWRALSVLTRKSCCCYGNGQDAITQSTSGAQSQSDTTVQIGFQSLDDLSTEQNFQVFVNEGNFLADVTPKKTKKSKANRSARKKGVGKENKPPVKPKKRRSRSAPVAHHDCGGSLKVHVNLSK